MVALKSVKEDCILILGGYDKGGDFCELAALINEKVKKVILYGAAAAKIENQLLGRVNAEIISVYSLKDAVENAYQNSENIKYVLFSPGCASFDQFKNFEERGEYFKKYVNEIKEKIG
jgi:UDP-N-acetylmuramoylalanine--D-glutamate ligase